MSYPASGRRFRRYRESVRQRQVDPQSVQLAPGTPSDDLDRSTKPATVGARQRSFLTLFAEFWRLIRAHHSVVITSILLLAVATLLRLLPPYGTKLAIDCVLTNPPEPMPSWLASFAPAQTPFQWLIVISLFVVVITLITTGIGLMSRWLATKSVNQATVTVRQQLFAHTIRLPLNRIQDMKSGGVASLLREDGGGVADLIFSLLYNPFRAIVQLVGSIVILMIVDWKLMLGGMLLIPAVWLTHRTWISRVRPLFRDVRRQRQRIDATATETFGGIRVVRTFARDRSETKRFVREGNFLVRQQLFTWWWTRIIELVWEVLIPLASTGLLVYGGYQILQGELTLGELMMFLVYLTMLLDPLATLAGSAVSFQNNLAGLDRVLDVLQTETELPTRPGSIAVDRSQVRGDIEIEQVSFHYPGNESQVLDSVTLNVRAGQTIALVGRSGAGKTTLTNLIARFYDPTAGAIRLDGRDLRDIELESYRRLLGIVEQDVFLFDGTVRDNIAYALPSATDEQIIAAAQSAAADEFVRKLPLGYDTVIGERGVRLSGGQRQRIAIARALLADPKILILDEATSSLDSESERLIQASLKTLLQGRTSFVIAHRLSTIREADAIGVLEDGRLVQFGTHAELSEVSGRYRSMIAAQTV